MKIAFLNIYNGVVERGSEVFVKELASRLSQKHAVCVFQSGKKGKENYQVKHIGGIPFSPYSWLYDFRVLIFTLKCLPILWKEKYDWIIPINGRWQAVFCRLLRYFCGGKILISGHAGVGMEDWINLIIGRPEVFVTLTPRAYRWAKSLSSKKVVYIPNGVDLRGFEADLKGLKLPFPKPVILCVAALLPYKRIDLLIKAMELIPNVNLLLIGDGILREKIEKYGKDLLGKRFLLISHVAHEEISRYYHACDIFSLPSKESEAFGLVYLEAMAANIPIVAPDDENRRLLIGDAGLYCIVTKTNEYAETLKKALKVNWGNKPLTQANNFSWEKIALKYSEIFTEKI